MFGAAHVGVPNAPGAASLSPNIVMVQIRTPSSTVNSKPPATHPAYPNAADVSLLRRMVMDRLFVPRAPAEPAAFGTAVYVYGGPADFETVCRVAYMKYGNCVGSTSIRTVPSM